MTFQVRTANPEEYDEITSLIIGAYADLAAVMAPDAWSTFANDISNVRGRVENGQQIVCELDGEIIGTLTVYLNWKGAQADAASVRLLSVAKAHRNKGAARAMLRWVVAAAERAGKSRVVTSTITTKSKSRQPEDSAGFKRCPELDHQPAPGVFAIGYSLELHPAGA